MREARGKKQFGAPGKGGPAGFAFYSPRPQLLRGFTKEKGNAKSTSETKPSDGVAATRGSVADAFFGASPVVASALGTAPSATPARLIEPTMGDSGNDSKPELSTLLGTGTFYFALTPRPFRVTDAHSRLRQCIPRGSGPCQAIYLGDRNGGC